MGTTEELFSASAAPGGSITWALGSSTSSAGAVTKARAAAGLERVHTVPGKHFPQEDQAPAIARQIAEFARVSERAGG